MCPKILNKKKYGKIQDWKILMQKCINIIHRPWLNIYYQPKIIIKLGISKKAREISQHNTWKVN